MQKSNINHLLLSKYDPLPLRITPYDTDNIKNSNM